MSKWIAEFELEDGDTMPEHMDLEYKGVRIDFHCKPQEPTTKNDLGVDCISRDSAVKALDYDIESFEFKLGVSKHMDDIVKLLNTIYEIQVNNIKALPSVTPIRPKGHWIWCGGSHKCSNCEEYTCFSHKVRYCPNCGSDNREVEDGKNK